ncbi:MAG TPA: 4-demethylwyosine synthase TYW1 [Candidatus Nanoarchaeia archaeon]|nr:4-demethylwyosine synthase TYW1 [Candidatus Nanoarchaeia archaeon]
MFFGLQNLSDFDSAQELIFLTCSRTSVLDIIESSIKMLSKNIMETLKKQHYAVVGNHSAVQICRWAKKSLIDEGFCYKQKFYGIKSHRCCQMSPFLSCPNECLHCWRPIELSYGLKAGAKGMDSPKKIIDECILAQRKLLTGFKGDKNANIKKWREAQEPNQFAISLIGEPTLYAKLAELILELKKRGKTSFLVTNGLYPEKLKELKKKNALPTQLYISLNTPNKEMYGAWHKSKLKDAWKRFNESLDVMKKLKGKTRRVIRMTLVKEKNMQDRHAEDYAKLIKKAEPDFIEVKGYMAVGFARKRLGYEKMPFHHEIRKFARILMKYLPGYRFLDEKIESRVVLLGKSRKGMKIFN